MHHLRDVASRSFIGATRAAAWAGVRRRPLGRSARFSCPAASCHRCDPAQWPADCAAVSKSAEPYAHSSADDDATSVFTRAGGCDYRITFGYPPGDGER